MLAAPGPETANCDGEIETPVMFRVAVPVLVTVTPWEELVVLIVTDPKANDVGLTVPWAGPVEEPATVSLKVDDADVPLLAHARTST
jgi:hypothetical protein